MELTVKSSILAGDEWWAPFGLVAEDFRTNGTHSIHREEKDIFYNDAQDSFSWRDVVVLKKDNVYYILTFTTGRKSREDVERQKSLWEQALTSIAITKF